MAIKQDYGLVDNPIFTGDDLVLRFQMVVDQSGVEVAENISTHEYSFVLRSTVTGGAILTKTTQAGSIVRDDGDTTLGEYAVLSSVVKIEVLDTETDIAPGSYSYQVKRTDPGAEIIKAYGNIYFTKGLVTA